MSRPDHQAMRNRIKIAQVLLAVIVVFGALIVGKAIVTGSLFRSPYRVVVELPDAAGLHKRSDVTYRGQHVGLVQKVGLSDRGVRVTVRIDAGVRIPRDSQYVVANLSPVGEQYLDIRPRTAAGPFLVADEVIDGSRAELPLPTWKLLADTQNILKRIDVDDIRTISREIDAVFGPQDVDLPGLLDEFSRTLGLADELSPQMFRLLAESRKPLQTMSELTPELRMFVANARTVAAALRKAAPGIGRLIDQGAVVIPVVSAQFDAASPTLVSLLDAGTPVAQMAAEHLPGLQHWYEWTPRQMNALVTATRGGVGRVIMVITAAENCRYGRDVSPYQLEVEIPLSARCRTIDPAMQQRGSQYVPRP
ncbi:MAG: MlaD family protein [Propionibacteriales bacterium]|nr:MlaD family protein [Propionibacteriales bacterium]